MENEDSQKGVAALERAFRILGAFQDGADGQSLGELAKATGYYKSTILRLCASLERNGYLARRVDGRFVLGATLFQLGQSYQRSFRLVDVVRPVLHELVDSTGESATLWIADDKYRVCLARADSRQRIRDAAVYEGHRELLDNTATGKVLRRFAKAEKPVEAKGELVSISIGFPFSDLAGMACPVLGSNERLVGALTLSGPTSRFNKKAVVPMRKKLIAAAKSLSRTLGSQSPIFDS